jgi:hypothetical protein
VRLALTSSKGSDVSPRVGKWIGLAGAAIGILPVIFFLMQGQVPRAASTGLVISWLLIYAAMMYRRERQMAIEEKPPEESFPSSRYPEPIPAGRMLLWLLLIVLLASLGGAAIALLPLLVRG